MDLYGHQITAIRKPNRDSRVEHITHVQVGGTLLTSAIVPVENVIRNIKAGERYFVRVGSSGSDVIVVPPSLLIREHIKTKPDLTLKDNLLSLPEC